MILSKQTCCLLLTGCFNRESKTYLRTSDKAGFFTNITRIYKCWTCAELCEAFTFPVENIMYITYNKFIIL